LAPGNAPELSLTVPEIVPVETCPQAIPLNDNTYGTPIPPKLLLRHSEASPETLFSRVDLFAQLFVADA
jgi:hypothetical protein